jgi:hypothetical protein
MKPQHLFVMALTCASSAWATSPPVPTTCVNTGPTRECIAPTPMPLPPTAPLSVRPAPPSGNLLVNGSFEQPALATGAWQVFNAIPGWVVVDGPGVEVQRGAAGAAQHGEQLVELDSHANSAMVQAVAVQAGVVYELRFWTMARPGTTADTNGLDVFVNDVRVQRVRHTEAPGFQEVRLRWTAGPDVALAVLRFEASGCSDSLGSYLDNVSWRAVDRP